MRLNNYYENFNVVTIIIILMTNLEVNINLQRCSGNYHRHSLHLHKKKALDEVEESSCLI